MATQPQLPESALDEIIRHNIDLTRYSNHAVRRMLGILNRADSDIFAVLIAALERLPAQSYTVEYLEAMLGSVRALVAQAREAATVDLGGSMRDLAGLEADWQFTLYRNSLPITTNLAQVTAEQAYVAAYSRPFQGRLLKEWGASLEADKMTRIRSAVRMGYLEGKPTAKIVQEIRGTRANKWQDGLIEIDRRHAEAVTRTALSHTAGVTRERFWNANADILGDEVWISTLDGRTSQLCRIRDHLHYDPKTHAPLGHKIPYGAGPGRLHWCCRSTSCRLLAGQKEFPGTRASAGGQVEAGTTYGAWLKRQPAAVQDDVLGTTRGALFRRGDLTIDQFSNDKGKLLTIDQLRERNAEAFALAGV